MLVTTRMHEKEIAIERKMSGSRGESISSTQSVILNLPPSCIEFCPAHPDLFVVGTYNLEKSEETQTTEVDGKQDEGDEDEVSQSPDVSRQPQNRNGSIILFQLREGKVHPVQTISQPSAIFDLHFQPHPDKGDVFAAVSSTGTVSVFILTVPEGGITASSEDAAPGADILRLLSVLRIPDLDEGALFTYFAWHPSIPGLVAISTASGRVILAQIHDDYQGLDVLENPILEHSLEAWVVAFSPPRPQAPSLEPLQGPFTVLTGGDDSALKYTSYDPSSETPTPYSPITLRDHTAGVTAILPLPLSLPGSQIVLLTGSYDDTLRVFAIAPLHTTFGAKQAKLLAERDLGGGVWRLQMIGGAGSAATSANEDGWAVTVLASCMHAGTRVLRITKSEGGGAADVEIEVLARFEEHQSMNYGSDWSRVEGLLDGDGGGEPRRAVVVSTSFYDRLLCVWSVSI